MNQTIDQISTPQLSSDYQNEQYLKSYLLAQQLQFQFEEEQEKAERRMLFNFFEQQLEEYDEMTEQIRQIEAMEQRSIEEHEQEFLELQSTLQREKEQKSWREVIVTHDNQSVVQLIKGEKCCFICTGQLFNNFDKVSKTECQHFFHTACLDRWIDNRKQCPKCRSKVSSGLIQEIVSTNEFNQSIPSNQENRTKVI